MLGIHAQFEPKPYVVSKHATNTEGVEIEGPPNLDHFVLFLIATDQNATVYDFLFEILPGILPLSYL